MNYDVTNKVEGIKTDIANTNEEEENLDEYYDENLDQEKQNYDNKLPNNNKFKKKIIKLMMIIGVGMLVLLIILSLVSKFTHHKYTLEAVEEIMKTAAQDYFKENLESLPQNNEQTVEIDVAKLVASNKMKSLKEYFGGSTKCTGKVQVTKTEGKYLYRPYLICDGEYTSKLLKDTLLDDKNIVGSGYGLYKMDNSYVFRGENVNNYIQLEAKLWRIVKVNSDKTITLILDELSGYSYPYDDRYNQTMNYASGINNYYASRIKERLDSIYNLTNEKDENYILSEKDKTKMVSYELCTGKVSSKDTIHNNSIECSQKMSVKLGLLTVSDYMNASIDTACTTPVSASCQNYNYLAINNSYWLVTANSEDTYSAYNNSKKVLKSSSASQYSGIRPVITLSSDTLVVGGDGTQDYPYIVK